MARLPSVGGDNGQWGAILNDFLSVEHNADGTLKKAGDISAALSTANAAQVDAQNAQSTANGKYTKPGSGIPETDLDSSVQTKLNAGAPDATNNSKGVVQLAGDLGGTAANPTVPGLSSKANTNAVLLKTNNLSDLNDTMVARQNLGLTIGTHVQAWNASLDAWSGKTAPSGDTIGTTDTQTLTNKTLTSPVITSPSGLVKADVGLGNVDNTSDTNKPISAATQTALDNKVTKSGDTMTGNLGVTLNDINATSVTVTNTANNSSSAAGFVATSDANRTFSLLTYASTNTNNSYNGRTVLDANTNALGISIAAAAPTSSFDIRTGGRATTNRRLIIDSAGGAQMNQSFAASSGTQTGLVLNTSMAQSGTAGYVALSINAVETSTGSGAKLLINAQVGGTSRYYIDNTGSTVMASTATNGLQLFNTTDQTTNYEVGKIWWNSNTFDIRTLSGGTGSQRAIRIGTTATTFTVTDAGARFTASFNTYGASTTAPWQLAGTLNGASLVTPVNLIQPTISQSGTAGYTSLLINTIETTTGSGTKRLIDAQVGGTSMMTLSNTGQLALPTQGATGGLSIGGDTILYRESADLLRTDDQVKVNRTNTTDLALRVNTSADANPRWQLTAGGTMSWGSGTGATDVSISRTAASTLTLGDGNNVAFGATTGTQLATTNTQKLGLWGAAPIAQPTTAVTSATRVGNGGAALTDTDTFDGYTLAQIVKALRNAGFLA